MIQIDGSQGSVYRYGLGLVWDADADPATEFPYTIYVMEDSRALGAQRVFRGRVWFYLGGIGLILLLLQTVILQWSLRPLRRVITELTKVQRGETERMSERHPRELEPLTDSINAFIESERENLERQRNTLADLAHSLKTPIAVLRTQMDSGAGDGALREELDVQLQRMNNLVSYQLARAASSGHKLFSAPLPIESNAEEIVRGLEKVYASKGVLCEFDIDPAARFHGEPGDLQELLGNLLENAFVGQPPRVADRATAARPERAPRRPAAGRGRRWPGHCPGRHRQGAAAWRAWRRARAGPRHRPVDRAGPDQGLPRRTGRRPFQRTGWGPFRSASAAGAVIHVAGPCPADP